MPIQAIFLSLTNGVIRTLRDARGIALSNRFRRDRASGVLARRRAGQSSHDNDPHVWKYLGPPSRLEDDIAQFERDGYGLVAIVEAASQSVVGYAKLQRPEWKPGVGLELVVAVVNDARCKGYAKAAAKALIALACGSLKEPAVVGRVSTNNIESLELIKRLDMSKTGQREDLYDGTQYIYTHACGDDAPARVNDSETAAAGI